MENDATKMNDHDLLVTMHEQMKNVRADIKEIKDGTSIKLEDHETRLRSLEKIVENWTGRNVVFGIIIMFIIGLLGSLMSKLF